MDGYLKRSWAVVDLDVIGHNADIIRNAIRPGAMMMGVIKADAYGHGDRYVASELIRRGVDWLGVSNLVEALALRRDGVKLPILILGYTPPQEAQQLADNDITQTVFSLDYAHALSDALHRGKLNIHIKVDTGMSRLGFCADAGVLSKSVGEVKAICALKGIAPRGIFTHFACADMLDDDSVAYTRGQYAKLTSLIGALKDLGIEFQVRHCCNSAGTMNYPDMHLDMVRAGIILYGLNPSGQCEGKLDIRPAMSLYSYIAQVKEVQQGTCISYGRTFTAPDRRIVATVPIGYADGYGRDLSNRAQMLVGGQFAPVIGRVCMDQLMLDITDIPDVAAGDKVTVVGLDGENTLTFEDLAKLSGTIGYEKACLVGKRVPRVYVRNGQEIAVLDDIRDRAEWSV